ncbi:Putative acyltransferase [Rheinheimera sp. A13L]|uniref:acyltransferase family protein n=1 Tax=Rheinheimera sp. A13L TaxID=506534 RepID=UPI000212549F|nr:SGNH hydrolase domain-containing protein [Rheinheimera sp. A13L]EGM78155.1 Putative acyltransferase [Rheinheimera sp. A13L]
MEYRREIDGLRAVAVLPVILFHAGFNIFSGGFVGVDVFFVISGYLITTIIIAELDRGNFSLINFYERRARRLLPALFFVIFACLPFAWFYLLPQEMRGFSQSLIAVVLFASNIFFWQTSGYFEVTSELNVLLHTWSLAVEEQYYVLFPLFLMATWRFGKRWVFVLLLILLLISLFVADWASTAMPVAAFYLLPTRGWELLAGSLSAFYMSRRSLHAPWVGGHYFNSLASSLGILLIAYAVLFFDKQTPFPGFYTLIPVVGSVLVILFATEKNLIGKLLGHKVFVGVGLVSYSAYLWHQPLFAFARIQSPGKSGAEVFVVLTALTLFLAYFSWRYVEQPFRNRTMINRRQVLIFSVTGSMFFMVLGFIGYKSDGFKSRLPPNITWQSLGAKLLATGDVCALQPVKEVEGALSCEFGDVTSSKSVFLYGDSHSQAISGELNSILLSSKIKGVKIALEGCEVIPDNYNTTDFENINRDCTGAFDRLLAYMRKSSSDIVISSRWTFKLYPIAGEVDHMASTNSEGGLEKDASYRQYAVLKDGRLRFEADDKKEAIRRFLNNMLSIGGDVYLVYPVPEISWDIARTNMEYYSENNTVLDEISIPYEDFKKRNKFINKIFEDFETNERFIPVKPESLFCDTYVAGRCVAQYEKKPFYIDDDHLSDAGARLVIQHIYNHMLINRKIHKVSE